MHVQNYYCFVNSMCNYATKNSICHYKLTDREIYKINLSTTVLEESFKKVLEEEFLFIKSNDIIDFFILVNNSKMTIKKEVIIFCILTLVMKT